jgi:hypothetical protein
MTAWSDEKCLIDSDGKEAYGSDKEHQSNFSIKLLRIPSAKKTKRKNSQIQQSVTPEGGVSVFFFSFSFLSTCIPSLAVPSSPS